MDDYGDEVRLKNTLEPESACEATSKSVTRCALCVHARGNVHVARVHVIALVVDAVVGLTLGLMTRVVVIVFVVEFP